MVSPSTRGGGSDKPNLIYLSTLGLNLPEAVQADQTGATNFSQLSQLVDRDREQTPNEHRGRLRHYNLRTIVNARENCSITALTAVVGRTKNGGMSLKRAYYLLEQTAASKRDGEATC